MQYLSVRNVHHFTDDARKRPVGFQNATAVRQMATRIAHDLDDHFESRAGIPSRNMNR